MTLRHRGAAVVLWRDRLLLIRYPPETGVLTELNYDRTGLVRDHSGRTVAPTASIMDTKA